MSSIIKLETEETFLGKLEDDNNLKCGTIVFSNNARFRFSCTFCHKVCAKASEFFRHILYDHLNYLDDYQFSDDEDYIGHWQNRTKQPFQSTEFVDVDTDKLAPPPIERPDFMKHYETFVSMNLPVTIKTELSDEEEEEGQIDPPADESVKADVQDIVTKADDATQDSLHIEILQTPKENELIVGNSSNNEAILSESLASVATDDDAHYLDDLKEDGYEESSEDGETQTNEDKNAAKENAIGCTKCSKAFVSKIGLKRHMTTTHGTKSPALTCDRCGKPFKNETQLDMHIKRHLGVKPYPCEICGTCFSDKSNLNVHILRHKGIRPHKCTICDKRFHSTTERKLHLRTHTGERPFVCEVCGRKFSNSGHLCSHRRRHYGDRRFQCDQCAKKFFDRKLLNDHKVMHTDERPFACETCGATFQRKKALLQHEKLHSGLKQYVCKICGKSFAQNAGLYSHMKYH